MSVIHCLILLHWAMKRAPSGNGGGGCRQRKIMVVKQEAYRTIEETWMTTAR